MDYTQLVHTIVDPLVSNPESLLIRTTSEKEKDITILICSENNDTARLIGKKGCVANAIREVISVASKIDGKRIHVKFESFGAEEK